MEAGQWKAAAPALYQCMRPPFAWTAPILVHMQQLRCLRASSRAFAGYPQLNPMLTPNMAFITLTNDCLLTCCPLRTPLQQLSHFI